MLQRRLPRISFNCVLEFVQVSLEIIERAGDQFDFSGGERLMPFLIGPVAI